MRINKKLERTNIFLLKLCRINNKIAIHHDATLLTCSLRYETSCASASEAVEIETDGVLDAKSPPLAAASKAA